MTTCGAEGERAIVNPRPGMSLPLWLARRVMG